MIIVALTLTSIFVLPNVKASISEAGVLSFSWYVAPSTSTMAMETGDLIVVGEVANLGSNIIGNVTVQSTALGANGQTLAVSSSQAFVSYMLPNQKAPFYTDFTAQSGSTHDLSWVPSVTHVVVTVTSVQDTNLRQYADLTIQGSINYTDNFGIYTVHGNLVNTGSQIANEPWVVTTFYNASGAVVGLNYTDYLAASLSPNNIAPFSASPVDSNSQLTSKIAGYSFQVDSYTVSNSTSPLPTTTPTPTTTPNPTIAPTPTSTPTVSPTSSDSQTPAVPELPALTIPFLIIIMAAAGLFVYFKKHKR